MMTGTFSNQMDRELAQLGVKLSQVQKEQFFTYYEMLVEKNKVMNLTGITEEHEVVTKHFSDSLSLLGVIREMKENANHEGEWFDHCRLIDVGTGAGFPGIPLKIVLPGLRVTLLDSLNKRVKFLEEVCHTLHLEGVTFVHGRAEDRGREGEHREAYDLCVSRAVANLSSLSEYCMPFVKVGGYFVPYKSGEIEEELEQAKKAIGLLGGDLKKVEKFLLPGTDAARSLVVIEKVKGISKKYPRKAGIPGKEPLGC